MLSTPSLIKNINNANYKGNVNEKSNEQMNSGDTRHAQAIIDSFTFKKIKTEGDEVKLEPEETIAEGVKLRRQKVDDKELSDMPPLEGDEEKVKEKKELKTLTPKKLLTRLLILLAQIKTGSNLYKLKNEIKQILYLLYPHNKITKKVYNNLMNSSQ